MNFYLSALDDMVKSDVDNPSIGIILCKEKDSVKAEYALRNISTPIGIANFELTEAIPENFKSKLPTVEEFEAELKEMD